MKIIKQFKEKDIGSKIFIIALIVLFLCFMYSSFAVEDIISYREEIHGDEIHHFYNLDCSKLPDNAVYTFDAYAVGKIDLNCKYVEGLDVKIMQLHYVTFLVQKIGEVN